MKLSGKRKRKMLKIENRQIAQNRRVRTEKIKYIVIHDTQNTSHGADSEAHFKYFNSANRNSSADFFVDSEKIIRANDYNTFYTWHVGDGKGKYGITNNNSIGIELCINEDGDINKTKENAIALVNHLMNELGIKKENVVRHYDASRKICPRTMSENNWGTWYEFYERIGDSMDKFTDIEESFAKKDIKDLYKMGVVSGKTETVFAPGESVTREELARVARNIIRYITGE